MKLPFRRPAPSALPLPDRAAQMGLLVQQADGLRDAGRPAEAANAYRAALVLDGSQQGLRVQLGNMLKDSGQFAAAEQAYL